MRRTTGRYEPISWRGKVFRGFVPDPLPPNPPVDLSGSLHQQLERALLALGRLDAISALLPNPELFLYGYVRREALLSSQIEGTQSSFSDLLLFEIDEAPGVPFDDVVEVSSYVAALDYGLGQLAAGFPLSNRLVREIHRILLSRGRGANKRPGEFREEPVWIGGLSPETAEFVPPGPAFVEPCMAELERFLHSEVPGGVLIRAGLAHAQFEAIHPFLDGNGRAGRLLISLILAEAGVLRQPLLYLSLYFKTYRSQYYRLLNATREGGDWEDWLAFFLEGVTQTAGSAVETAHRLVGLFERDAAAVRGVGRQAGTALRVLEAFRRRPLLTVKRVASDAGMSYASADRGVQKLVELGIVREITQRRRDRLFVYRDYLDILNEGAEPLSR
ncbi:Fic family protein [Tepidiforma flava]|uniref:Fic family protein n=1 Tax=Tepidiforma flava TaxID=3004094 RepID=A0ABY7M5L3_9CHLR|nr:Fic family protein [Tepidiforma flava]WBL34908.1 Fic family protein [Tepidiforma flava]